MPSISSNASRVLFLAVLLIVLGSAQAAHADVITFSTSGSFGTFSSQNGNSPNYFTLHFGGESYSIDCPGSSCSDLRFGTFILTRFGQGGGAENNEPFTLSVFQTIPYEDTATFLSTFSGMVTGGGPGPIVISFSETSKTIYGSVAVTYTLSLPAIIEFPSLSEGQSETRDLLGSVRLAYLGNGSASVMSTGLDGSDNGAAAPAPEPGTMILLGSGFVSLAIASRRRHLGT